MRIALTLSLLAILGLVPVPAGAQTPEEPETPATAEPTPAPAASPTPEPVTVPTVFYEKLNVLVDGKAEVNGVVQLQFQARGQDPKLVSVNVLRKMKAKDIARDIHKELSLAAGSLFKIKLGGKKVSIKRANKKGPAFALTIIGQSVSGVSVATKR
jgi:hypothetical protein